MEQYENSLAHLKAARIIYIEVKGEDSEDVKDITDLIESLADEMNDFPGVDADETDFPELDKQADIEKVNDNIKKHMSLGHDKDKNHNSDEAKINYLNALNLTNTIEENDENTETIANINFYLGRICKKLEEYKEAEEYLIASINSFTGLHGANYFETARSYSQLGDVYYYQDDYHNAIKKP